MYSENSTNATEAVTVAKDDTTDPELTQFISTVVSIACALTCILAYHAFPKWRQRNHVYAKQMFLKCVATCCIFSLFFLPPDQEPLATVLLLVIIIINVLGTAQTVGLGHLYIALNCEDISDEETVVQTSWFYMASIACLTIYVEIFVLNLDLSDIECIGAVLMCAILSGNVLVLSRLFTDVGKCNINIFLMFSAVILGIAGDVLLVVYAIILLIMDSNSGLLFDVVGATFASTMFVQTILILFSKDALDWKRYRPVEEAEEAIEMENVA